MKASSRVFRTRIEKRYWDGTHRSLPPELTVQRLKPFMTQYGITRLANVTGLDWIGIPVVMACRPNSRSLSVFQGKGLTLDAAKASALMEAIEFYYAERLALPIMLGTYKDLSKKHVVVSTDQLPIRKGARLHDQQELLWVEGYDLIQRQSTWVPYACVSTNGVTMNLPGHEYFTQSSNGLASGNHLLEAIVHGICEVVERDATTLWYIRNKAEQQASCLDLTTCSDLTCKKLIDHCQASGIQMLVWETTSDVGLPAFMCLMHEDIKNLSRIQHSSVGMGCHVSRNVALVRAITESAQKRLTLIAGARDDVFRNQYEESYFGFSDLMRYRSLHPQHATYRSFTDAPSFESETFNDDIEFITKKLQRVGINSLIVVTLSEPDLHFQIVRVIIPGLEGSNEHPLYSRGCRAQTLMRHRT